jgi:Tfp pilus assembly protein PilO
MKHKPTTPPAKRTWLFALAITGGVCAYILGVFLPGQRATAELRREFEKQREFVEDCARLGEQIAAQQQELDRTLDYTDTWRDAAPSEARLAHVFVSITRHGSDAGIEIVRFEPQTADHMTLLKRVPLEIAFDGDYRQIFDFIARLETLDSDFWIESLRVDPLAGSQRLRCELRLVFFADRSNNSD